MIYPVTIFRLHLQALRPPLHLYPLLHPYPPILPLRPPRHCHRPEDLGPSERYSSILEAAQALASTVAFTTLPTLDLQHNEVGEGVVNET